MRSRFAAVELVQLDAPELSPTIDIYLQQIDRIVGVIADPELTEKLAADEFRLKMQPIGFLDLYQFQPIVTLRIWCDRHNIVHLKSLDYEFKGLEAFMDGVELTVVGTLACLRNEAGQGQLSGKADLAIELTLPPPLWLTPQPLLKATGDRILSEVLQRIKQQILKQLIQDYIDWTKVTA